MSRIKIFEIQNACIKQVQLINKLEKMIRSFIRRKKHFQREKVGMYISTSLNRLEANCEMNLHHIKSIIIYRVSREPYFGLVQENTEFRVTENVKAQSVSIYAIINYFL